MTVKRPTVLPFVIALLGSFSGAGGLDAQEDRANRLYDPALYGALEYRSIGPFRGGRVTAVAGVPSRPFTFYHGTTGGGVWRTDNAGTSWRNVSDGFFAVGSIGAIDVSLSDPDVIYVGTGSADIRGNVSTGRGMYRSDDAGESWRFLGLEDAGQIARVRIHPADPALAYVAATGHPFGRNPQRGVFRTRDGGATWEKVLFVSDSIGAIDLAMDPSDPRVLYAAMWRGERKPWTMISGAHSSSGVGLYKTTDGGDRWTRLRNGLPAGLVGKIGVTVSPVNPRRLWAIVEAGDGQGGVYRSDDAGASWSRVSDDARVQGRPWYYHHIYADPKDAQTVWIAGGDFWKSTDGGETFRSFEMPHGDHHDLWLNPDNPAILVEGNDGGANVSLDGGKTWSVQLNQPTAEFYSVTVDDQFPYRVYGPQQDNSTVSLPSFATGTGISLQHWRVAGGCETGPVAVRPDDPNITYAGCFGGHLARVDRRTEQFRQIRDYPEEMGGMPTGALKYRFQWNAPITLSPHDPDVLYHGSQYVHRTTNEGQSWEIISPDLTRNDTSKFAASGEPITADATGVEVYSALLAIEESPHARGEIWTGSNDGVVSLTRDGGATWDNVTPPDLPVPSTVNRIEISPHVPGKAYVVAYRYRLDDWQPYILRTTDYGRTWTRLTSGSNGIPADHPTRTVREDPERPGLLYAGTEFGLFVSFDDGAHWQSLQNNLPVTPVTDLRVHRGDLVVATQGRSFWILDDLAPLRQLTPGVAGAEAHLYEPRAAYRTAAQDGEGHYDRDEVYGAMLPSDWKGANPPAGAILYYHLASEPVGEVVLEVLEDDGDVVRTFRSTAGGRNADRLPARAGLNRFVWDLHYPGTRDGRPGPRAVPGRYRVRLSAAGRTQVRDLEVRKDPRLVDVTRADLQAQFDFVRRAQRSMDELLTAVERLRALRQRVGESAAQLPASADRERERAEALLRELDRVEGRMIATGEGSRWAIQPRIRRHLAAVITNSQSQRGVDLDARPTDQLVLRLRDLEVELADALGELARLTETDLPAYDRILREHGIQPVAAAR